MDECAACGAAVDGATTYCDDCGDRSPTDGRDPASSATTAGTDRRGADGVAAPTERGVAALLGVAAVVGGVTTLESLSYLPQAFTFFSPPDTAGYLVTQAVDVTLVVAFAVGAKRLADGGADPDRYGRALKGLAVASVVLTAVASYYPFGTISRWIPTAVDPGSMVLNVVGRYLFPRQLAFGPLVVLLGIAAVGAAVSYGAGVALERT